jgi:hypothetical protein
MWFLAAAESCPATARPFFAAADARGLTSCQRLARPDLVASDAFEDKIPMFFYRAIAPAVAFLGGGFFFN